MNFGQLVFKAVIPKVILPPWGRCEILRGGGAPSRANEGASKGPKGAAKG